MSKYDMPDRVWCFDCQMNNRWSKDSFYDGSVEYIRADLVAGDANEPLEDGQYRWVSVGGERHVVRLEEDMDSEGRPTMLFCTTDGCAWSVDFLDCIGPVIRSPEGV